MPPADVTPAHRRFQASLPGLLLFLAVLGLYLPALRNGFVNYDDPEYVTSNALVQDGLTWAGLRWALGSSSVGYWHPVTWLSHMADCQIYGLKPWGHHLSSVLLHAVNTLLLFLFLRKMTGATWRSLVVAALFGMHPLHVESVAWVAERKDVLSTLFVLLAMWAYAAWAPPKSEKRKAKSGNGIYYALALLFFALGLMTKPMVVSLPFVLLILDYWPLNRFASSAGSGPWRTAARLVAEKIPFFACAAATGMATMIFQRRAGAVGDLTSLPLAIRIENPPISCCRYLVDIFYPAKLAVFYPYPSELPLGQALGAGALLLAITAGAVAFRRKYPWLLAGWIWYLATLAPVIGLVQAGAQSRADRYTYVPAIGIFVMLIWGAQALTARWRRQALLAGALATVVLVSCALLTRGQIAYWRNSETLFRHELAVAEDNSMSHNNLGNALAEDPGRQSEAMEQYEEALRIGPETAGTRNNLAIALAKAGKTDAAVAQYEEALRLKPNEAKIHSNFANFLRHAGRLPQAIAQYEEALRLDPDSYAAHNNLGIALADTGRMPEAITHYEEALRLKPAFAEARHNLGNALFESGRTAEAVAQYRETLRLNPDFADALRDLAYALANSGQNGEAAGLYERAVRLEPNDVKAREGFGTLLFQMGRASEAVGQFAAASRLSPDDPRIHYILGCALAGMGRTAEAEHEFKEVLRLKPDDADARANLELLRIPRKNQN